MSKIDVTPLNTAFENLKDGAILLFQKNSDGTFSPISLERSHGRLIQGILAECSKESPLYVLKEVKVKQLT
nr:MAG TPA: hypothetical protein [Caudoviricetes sp.]